ncbi:hypothetical protein CkaCkLH20_07668 [Colletotrichum karsti]|uniref:HNH nuclease domain-containing protein n=1 Tax=Colletotrichum karsti TaxID=1095194 RepID=A0A9P6I2R8_9PEZI|nr:uncharacterized protein CkaCkLH20_07668 [Colletotrichum karsti]KAF9874974.1 hypothetical protein CkaCkLH20_07668 [Colletotrichum karsti]
MTLTTRPPKGAEYLGDLDIKLPLVVDIRSLLEPYVLLDNGLEHGSIWAALLSKDVPFLKELHNELENADTDAAFRAMRWSLANLEEYLPLLLRLFRGGNMMGYVDANTETTDGKRDAKVTAQARACEGNRCAILGTADPQIYHVFPLAAIHHRESLSRYLDFLAPFLGEDLARRLGEKLAGSDGSLLDDVRNVIALDGRLHKYWADGRFALEPLGPPTIEDLPQYHHEYIQSGEEGIGRVDPKEGSVHVARGSGAATPTSTPTLGFNRQWCLELRFHWMKKNKLAKMVAPMDFGTDPFDSRHYEPSGEEFDHYNVNTSSHVGNGQIIRIFAKDPESLPDPDIFSIQFCLLSVWSLQGGADPALYKFFRDDHQPEAMRGFLDRIGSLAEEWDYQSSLGRTETTGWTNEGSKGKKTEGAESRPQ